MMLISGLLLTFWDAEDVATEIGDHLVCVDGWQLGALSHCGCCGCWCWCVLSCPEFAMQGAIWEEAEEHGDAGPERCRAFMPVPGPRQTVQRAEFRGTIMALQAYCPGHLGVANLDVWSSLLLGCLTMVACPGPYHWLSCYCSACDSCSGAGHRSGDQG